PAAQAGGTGPVPLTGDARARPTIVGVGLRSRFDGHADVVALDRFTPNIALQAGSPAVRIATLCSTRVFHRSSLSSLFRHAYMVVLARFSPYVAGLTAVSRRSSRNQPAHERAEEL